MEARDIRGHDVGGELGALEFQSRHAGEGGGQGGLTRTGDVLNQNVGARQHSGEQLDHLVSLTHNHLFHLIGGGNHLLVGGGHLGGHFQLGRGRSRGRSRDGILFGFVTHRGIPFLCFKFCGHIGRIGCIGHSKVGGRPIMISIIP